MPVVPVQPVRQFDELPQTGLAFRYRNLDSSQTFTPFPAECGKKMVKPKSG